MYQCFFVAPEEETHPVAYSGRQVFWNKNISTYTCVSWQPTSLVALSYSSPSNPCLVQLRRKNRWSNSRMVTAYEFVRGVRGYVPCKPEAQICCIIKKKASDPSCNAGAVKCWCVRFGHWQYNTRSKHQNAQNSLLNRSHGVVHVLVAAVEKDLGTWQYKSWSVCPSHCLSEHILITPAQKAMGFALNRDDTKRTIPDDFSDPHDLSSYATATEILIKWNI